MKALDFAIEIVGGVGRLATALGVGQSVVSNWRARGTLLEAKHCVAIERLTQGAVTRQQMRPADWWEIWPELAQPPGSNDLPATKPIAEPCALETKQEAIYG